MKKDYEFNKVEGSAPRYAKIESKLEELGKHVDPKDPWAGVKHKHRILKAAGWDVDKHDNYQSDEALAMRVFGKIEGALAQTDDPAEIERLLTGG